MMGKGHRQGFVLELMIRLFQSGSVLAKGDGLLGNKVPAKRRVFRRKFSRGLALLLGSLVF